MDKEQLKQALPTFLTAFVNNQAKIKQEMAVLKARANPIKANKITLDTLDALEILLNFNETLIKDFFCDVKEVCDGE